MKANFKMFFSMSLLLIFLFAITAAAFAECHESEFLDEHQIKEPKVYNLLFFKNDDRIWIILPPKTTFVEIHPSTIIRQGWVKAYNKYGEVLALDNTFHGDVKLTTAVKKPSVWDGLIVVTLRDGLSMGVYVPENAAYIEILNEKNGFDGVVNVLDCRHRVLTSQSGLDVRIVDLKRSEMEIPTIDQ